MLSQPPAPGCGRRGSRALTGSRWPAAHPEQLDGVRNALESRLSLIRAGRTGKTASIRTIARGPRPTERGLTLCPTGRAAIRMSEASGVRARPSTPRSMDPGRGPTHDEHDPLRATADRRRDPMATSSCW